MSDHADLAPYLLGSLSPAERAAFESHMEECEDCTEEARTLAPAVRALENIADPDVPADLRRNTMAAIRRGRTVAARPASFWRRAVPALAAAAVALVALGVVVQRGPSGELVTLVAPDGGPARGTARVRETPEGLHVTLEVEGLKPNDGPYECWFVGPGDTEETPNRVSAGTFRTDPDGRARVVMVAAADADRFPNMGVTREPDDGNPQRTGGKVLVSQPN